MKFIWNAQTEEIVGNGNKVTGVKYKIKKLVKKKRLK